MRILLLAACALVAASLRAQTQEGWSEVEIATFAEGCTQAILLPAKKDFAAAADRAGNKEAVFPEKALRESITGMCTCLGRRIATTWSLSEFAANSRAYGEPLVREAMNGGPCKAVGILAQAFDPSMEEQYQHEADLFRARHLIEWARTIEAYYEKTGYYPLQRGADGDKILLVRIATREQQDFLDPGSPKYAPQIDYASPRFTLVSMRDFVSEIEDVLGREIDERYDPQRVPNSSAPIYMSYFTDKNGYLIWAACQTCPRKSNSFSTLLSRGTPTINIGSSWFIQNVPKTQSIASLQANKEFVDFIGKGPQRPGWFDQLERTQVHESKN